LLLHLRLLVGQKNIHHHVDSRVASLVLSCRSEQYPPSRRALLAGQRNTHNYVDGGYCFDLQASARLATLESSSFIGIRWPHIPTKEVLQNTLCALLVGCGTVRLTAAQFETFRCFLNWSSRSNNKFEDLIPSYSKLKTVLVRCMRKYCWAKSTILRFPVASERSGVNFGLKDGTLAPVIVVLPSS
jgi:hypothetical protein